MPERHNPWFAMVRAGNEAARLCIAAGYGAAQTRAMMIERGRPALPDAGPLRAWLESILLESIDRAIYYAVLNLEAGA